MPITNVVNILALKLTHSHTHSWEGNSPLGRAHCPHPLLNSGWGATEKWRGTPKTVTPLSNCFRRHWNGNAECNPKLSCLVRRGRPLVHFQLLGGSSVSVIPLTDSKRKPHTCMIFLGFVLFHNWRASLIYTLESKKSRHQSLVRNFAKCSPVLNIILPANWVMNV